MNKAGGKRINNSIGTGEQMLEKWWEVLLHWTQCWVVGIRGSVVRGWAVRVASCIPAKTRKGVFPSFIPGLLCSESSPTAPAPRRGRQVPWLAEGGGRSSSSDSGCLPWIRSQRHRQEVLGGWSPLTKPTSIWVTAQSRHLLLRQRRPQFGAQIPAWLTPHLPSRGNLAP